MRRLALALDLTGRPVTVVGGGDVAERKVRLLLEAGARIRVIAPETTAGLADLGEAVEWVPRAYRPGDLAGAALAFAATDDPKVNESVAAEAREAGIFCNVAAPPEAGDCHVMATVERGGVTIGIASGGASPYAAARMRELIEAAVPPELGTLTELIGELRGAVQERWPNLAERRAAYERMWSSPALQRLRAGEIDSARQILRECIG